MWILSLEKFFDTISRFFPGDPLSGKEEAIARLNPDKIYLENVRSVLGVSTARAAKFCESAVRQGLFKRAVEVVCPDGAVAASAETEAELPKTVRCWAGERGNLEELEMETSTLPKITFYRLNDKSASQLFRSAT
jgi:hypothetical protein